ncbi:brachyurin-like [Chironomus tepperi]|uniref:brachyurin-like n=1 Tax=Chironomus tepperi TaxID=113505 RepID=UPI00391EEF8D
MSMPIFLAICCLFVLTKCEILEMPPEFLNAKSPMESQFNLKVIDYNFPGLYDNVLASIEARIAGGESTNAEKFPYQVLMYMIDKNGSNFICGGSLITYEWVLTAAHCLHGFVSIAVFLGVSDRVNGPAVWSGNVTSRNQLFVHPQYIPTSHANDIALVRLEGIDAGILDHKNVETIAIPTAAEANINLIGMRGTVNGFGSTADTNKASNELRFVTMPIISNQQCQMTFGNFIKETNVCMSGNGGRSVCSGDSGGPLVAEISPGEIVQVGIVSFGHKHGCTLGHPGVFTRVTSYLKWIEGHTGKINRIRSSTINPIDGQNDNGNGNSATYIVIGKVFLILTMVTHLLL